MLTVSRHRHRPLAPRRVMIILRFLRRIAGLGGGPPPPPARQHRRRARARTRQARRIGSQIAFFCHPPRSLTDPLPTRQGFLSRRCRWVTVREFVPTLQPRLYPPIATSRFAGHGRPNCASCADTSAAVSLGRPRQETGSPCRARSAVLQPAAPAERLQRFFDRRQFGGRHAGGRPRGGHPREQTRGCGFVGRLEQHVSVGVTERIRAAVQRPPSASTAGASAGCPNHHRRTNGTPTSSGRRR